MLVTRAVNPRLKKENGCTENVQLRFILNNGEFNKMRHEDRNSNGFVNIKKEKLWLKGI